ncbi:MAG: GNAT family N-acetyltransferase [Tepidisphaeraceae bacterium]
MNDCLDAQVLTMPTNLPVRADVGPAGGALAIEPRVNITVRPSTLADVGFIDRMQKAHSRELGFLPLMAIEGKIRLGQVLIAEVSGQVAVGGGQDIQEDTASFSSLPPATCPLPTAIGYLIAADRYCRRDEVGYVTQINVLPEYRRHLVAAQLLLAQFDRSAYGCRLYSCWCAEDLAANEFWEAMGFTPIAFRTGARKNGERGGGVRREGSAGDLCALTPHASYPSPSARIHIFWQKRIRQDDTTTPWWYPAKTEGGEMREDRLVFPIPPGVHWRDVLPVVLPETVNRKVGDSESREDDAAVVAVDPSTTQRLTDSPTRRTKKISAAAVADPAERAAARLAIKERISEEPPPVKRPKHIHPGAMWAGPDWDAYEPTESEIDAEVKAQLAVKMPSRPRAETKAAPPPEKKVDPRLVEMSRELRDRWSEQATAIAALPGKYDVRRAISGPTPAVKMLAA